MRYYRVYLLDDSSRISGGFDLHCQDNRAACEAAARLCTGRRWELWSGAERIPCQASETTNAQHPASPSPENPSAEG